jgi:predicted DCC family thiol-disulfide oxidoreductase YuxK
MPALNRPLLLYDGGCRFCRASARLVARWDKAQRFSFLPMRDERAEPFARLVPEAQRFKSFHIIEPSGETCSKGAGVITLLSILRYTTKLGRLAAVLRLRPVMDIMYAAVARSRGFLGRFVRDAPGPVRWP